MILDMNIKLSGINEEFLNELDELIEDTRVEYFIINPKSEIELEETLELCKKYRRFKYTLPVAFREKMDKNCVAYKVTKEEELDLVENIPLVVESNCLNESFILALNSRINRGVVLDAKQSDTKLEKFAYSISHDSLKDWTKKGITDVDFNKLALQSNYPDFSYDELINGLLKDISDLTFRAEQTIAAGGTRTVLKTFELLQ
ncbi:hypothetical protein [Halarcobacter ebronensis]|uniref:Uncharacterized protein n=1 Tax=Halarcobacter ebronensis TaxID=1462615 RepID=A0A4Q1AX68_9BACT|nr:hypothetical protein [Halarcobacter ebronensis]QKF82517.1 hypothetical protein AEBR_2038 [Halarcobacter ebronensis]RXK07466.1 hypothetical protein CRV07_03115 [Halarcobacter ebronensis]